ncbi:hypothetical protein AK830_g4759 [Neonectria ditissima]|uniref:Uncharacterized protein n=1 Tax=Neonectria ditissima TaxID=78410 RepID=A0A0P7BFJ6_9HYPO|nr:hypothetical protein AK830_g4759 [Neonectria ditissima]
MPGTKENGEKETGGGLQKDGASDIPTEMSHLLDYLTLDRPELLSAESQVLHHNFHVLARQQATMAHRQAEMAMQQAQTLQALRHLSESLSAFSPLPNVATTNELEEHDEDEAEEQYALQEKLKGAFGDLLAEYYRLWIYEMGPVPSISSRPLLKFLAKSFFFFLHQCDFAEDSDFVDYDDFATFQACIDQLNDESEIQLAPRRMMTHRKLATGRSERMPAATRYQSTLSPRAALLSFSFSLIIILHFLPTRRPTPPVQNRHSISPATRDTMSTSPQKRKASDSLPDDSYSAMPTRSARIEVTPWGTSDFFAVEGGPSNASTANPFPLGLPTAGHHEAVSAEARTSHVDLEVLVRQLSEAVYRQAKSIISKTGTVRQQALTIREQADTIYKQTGTIHEQAGTIHDQAGTIRGQAGIIRDQAERLHQESGTRQSCDQISDANPSAMPTFTPVPKDCERYQEGAQNIRVEHERHQLLVQDQLKTGFPEGLRKFHEKFIWKNNYTPHVAYGPKITEEARSFFVSLRESLLDPPGVPGSARVAMFDLASELSIESEIVLYLYLNGMFQERRVAGRLEKSLEYS